MNKKIWGYHAIFDCSECDKNFIRDENHMREFIKCMVSNAKMKAYGEPLIKHVILPDNPVLNGYSIVQLIYTSSITCHFLDNTGDAYIDFFSCKKFNPKLIRKCILEYYNPKKITMRFIKRNANSIF